MLVYIHYVVHVFLVHKTLTAATAAKDTDCKVAPRLARVCLSSPTRQLDGNTSLRLVHSAI